MHKQDSLRRQIAITGAAGFIGSCLTRKYLKQDSELSIVAVDEVDFFKSRKCAQDIAEKIERISPEEFLEKGRDYPFEALFHMGACSNTEESRADYIKKVNLEYSQKLWELCSARGIPFFYASSAGTYGLGERGFSDEISLIPSLKPLSLYAQSKQDFDLWVLEQKKAPPRWAGFKFFNVYGPGEEHKGRQASMALHLKEQILKNAKVRLYKSYKKEFADGEQSRDFIYVGDVCNVLKDFQENPRPNSIYNLGTGLSRSFMDLARAVAAALGKKIEIEFIEMPETLKAQYQYWTQAEMGRLRAAGYKADFFSLEKGVQTYFKEWE